MNIYEHNKNKTITESYIKKLEEDNNILLKEEDKKMLHQLMDNIFKLHHSNMRILHASKAFKKHKKEISDIVDELEENYAKLVKIELNIRNELQ